MIGVCLYLVDTTMNADHDKNIFISDQEILSLISAWKSQVGRDPTDDELARIINNLIDEEILYREALSMGLDQNDTIIKRRLAQKISFLKEESIPNTPSIIELKAFFNKNKEKYFIQSSFSFNHYFFSINNDSLSRATKALIDINKDKQINSDPFYLGKSFGNETYRNIESNFGTDFSSKFINAPINKWIGPIKSIYGHHIVFISSYTGGYTPSIEDVLQQVEVDYLQANRDEAVNNFLNKIRSEYTVFINPDLKF